ncbi:MAG: hypothetical protein IJ846_08645 [Alphaproteobacteria bacterium]|nr:hypothetical protein [Alphaproteobacteria bacterium]
MEERKRRRIQMIENDLVGWQQPKNHQKREKGVFDNTTVNQDVAYRSKREAKQDENRLYAEKIEQNRQSEQENIAKKQRERDESRIRDGIQNKRAVEKVVEKTTGNKLSKEAKEKAEKSNKIVGQTEKKIQKDASLKTKKKKRSLDKGLEKNKDKEKRPTSFMERLLLIQGKDITSDLKVKGKENKKEEKIEKEVQVIQRDIENNDNKKDRKSKAQLMKELSGRSKRSITRRSVERNIQKVQKKEQVKDQVLAEQIKRRREDQRNQH